MYLAMYIILGFAGVLIFICVFLSVVPIYRCKQCDKRCKGLYGTDKLCKACWEASGGPQRAAEELQEIQKEWKRQEEKKEQRRLNKRKLAEERRAKRKQAIWYKTLLRFLLGMAFLVVILIIASVVLALFYSPQAVHFFCVAGICLLISVVFFILLAFESNKNSVPMGEGMAAIVAFGALIYAVYNLIMALLELFKSF